MKRIILAMVAACLVNGCGDGGGPYWPSFADWEEHFTLSDITYSDFYDASGKSIKVTGVVTNLDSATYYVWVMCRAFDANDQEINGNSELISPLGGHSSAQFNVYVHTSGRRSIARWENYVSCWGKYVPPPS